MKKIITLLFRPRNTLKLASRMKAGKSFPLGTPVPFRVKYPAIHCWCVLLLIILVGCSLRRETDSETKKNLPNMQQEDYNHYIYKNGREYLNVHVNLASFFDKQKKIEFQGIKAEVYNLSGETTTKISADNGTVDQDKKRIFFTGNVIVESFEQKIKLFTEKLNLDYQNDKLAVENESLIQKDDGSYLKSKSFESDVKLSETKFRELELQYFYKDEDNKDEKK